MLVNEVAEAIFGVCPWRPVASLSLRRRPVDCMPLMESMDADGERVALAEARS